MTDLCGLGYKSGSGASMISNPNGTSGSSRLRALLCVFLFIAAGIAVVGAIGSSRTIGRSAGSDGSRAGKIAPWVFEHTANGQRAEFIVVLTDQADLSGAAALTTKMEKGRYVYDALRNKSKATQTPILQWLRDRGIEHQSFYIVNAILVKGSREIAEALAARPDVARVEGNPQIKNILPQPDAIAEAPSQRSDRRRLSRASITRTRRMCGRWASGARESRSAEPILVSAGHITRSNLTTAAGTESPPITITTGMIPSTTALEILAATIRRCLATTSVMARIRSGLRLAMTAWVIRSGWRPARSGSVAVTWTRGTAHRQDTSNAWSGFLRLIR